MAAAWSPGDQKATLKAWFAAGKFADLLPSDAELTHLLAPPPRADGRPLKDDEKAAPDFERVYIFDRDEGLEKKELGKGAHGKVFKLLVVGSDEEVRAAKVVDLKKVLLWVVDSQWAKRTPETKEAHETRVIARIKRQRENGLLVVRNEAHILYRVSRVAPTAENDDILHVLRCPDPICAFAWRQQAVLVTELCLGGSLIDVLGPRSHGEKACSAAEVRHVFKQILKGVRALHELGLTHGDLKPDNILLKMPHANFETPLDQQQIKVGDFGHTEATAYVPSRPAPLGTYGYMARERILGYTGTAAVHPRTTTCDMYSCGVILFIMMFGYNPQHSSRKSFQRQFNVEIGAIPAKDDPKARPVPVVTKAEADRVEPQALDLVRKLMTNDADARLSAEAALQHPLWTTDPPADARQARVAAMRARMAAAAAAAGAQYAELAGSLDEDDEETPSEPYSDARLLAGASSNQRRLARWGKGGKDDLKEDDYATIDEEDLDLEWLRRSYSLERAKDFLLRLAMGGVTQLAVEESEIGPQPGRDRRHSAFMMGNLRDLDVHAMSSGQLFEMSGLANPRAMVRARPHHQTRQFELQKQPQWKEHCRLLREQRGLQAQIRDVQHALDVCADHKRLLAENRRLKAKFAHMGKFIRIAADRM